SDEFSNLARFDFAICFGLIHRLPDPFNFVSALAEKTDAILFEWISPPGLLSPDVPWAFHRQGGLYEEFNAVGNFESQDVAARARAGGGIERVSYWNMSFAAVETL